MVSLIKLFSSIPSKAVIRYAARGSKLTFRLSVLPPVLHSVSLGFQLLALMLAAVLVLAAGLGLLREMGPGFALQFCFAWLAVIG